MDDLQGHMDGGAQASTTNCLDYLYHYQPLSSPSTTLKVANNTPHHPIGIHFLCLPAHNTSGFVMVSTFYRPTLLATILSPSDLGSKLDCQSFTSFTSFDNNNCSLTLHHCQHCSQDIWIPLIVVCGLLYTAPFHKPSTLSEQLLASHLDYSICESTARCTIPDVDITASISHLS